MAAVVAPGWRLLAASSAAPSASGLWVSGHLKAGLLSSSPRYSALCPQSCLPTGPGVRPVVLDGAVPCLLHRGCPPPRPCPWQRGCQVSCGPQARAVWVGTAPATFPQQLGVASLPSLLDQPSPAGSCPSPAAPLTSPGEFLRREGPGGQGRGGSWGELPTRGGGTLGAAACGAPGCRPPPLLPQALRGRAGAAPAGLLAPASVPSPVPAPALLCSLCLLIEGVHSP